jgi:GNAT superfamily N-acetyltransferase
MSADCAQNDPEWAMSLRPVGPGDYHFLLNAWMQSYRVSAKGLNSAVYFQGQQNLIAELAKRRTLVIACDQKMPDYIYGFACGAALSNGSTLIDYIYVKKLYRKRGVAKALAKALGCAEGRPTVVTHLTPSVRGLVRARRFEHNPYYNHLGYSDV